jgi:hypothetical protein
MTLSGIVCIREECLIILLMSRRFQGSEMAEKKSKRKAFSGDFERELPKGKIEPYRLWFEYLKFALQEPWHDVLNSDFDEWWPSHWKPLFTVTASVKVIDTREQIVEAIDDDSFIFLRILKKGGRNRIERDVKSLLKGRLATGREIDSPRPQFGISAARSINYRSLRAMLKFLQLFRLHKNVEDATEAYCNWAKAWNEKVKEQNRPQVYIPQPLSTFCNAIEEHRKDQAKSRRRIKQSVHYNNCRSDVMRLLRKAQIVVRNVERGVFPGRG